MNPDGSGLLNLTSAPGVAEFALEPDWSADGTKLAFRSGRVAAGEIYTMNADGSGLTRLTSNSVKDYTPAWSPDGSMIVFASNRNDPNPSTCVDLFGTCEIDLFVMPATGGAPVQITFDSGTEHFPQFSPDGTFIAYNHSEGGGVSAINAVNLDNLAVTKLTPDSLRAGTPDYSPDGTRIAFDSNFYPCNTATSDCRTEIFVMNAAGGAVTQLTRQPGNDHDPAWSPEGDKIAFTHSRGAQFREQEINTMNPDGTEITRITRTNDESFGPDWGAE